MCKLFRCHGTAQKNCSIFTILDWETYLLLPFWYDKVNCDFYLIRCEVCLSVEAKQQEEEVSDVVEECIVQPFNELSTSGTSSDFDGKYLGIL